MKGFTVRKAVCTAVNLQVYMNAKCAYCRTEIIFFEKINPLKGRGVKWLHFAIQV